MLLKKNNDLVGYLGGVMILAAGIGKRMRSPLPKILHEIAGQPLLFHVLNRIYEVMPGASVGIVVGHGRYEVEAFVRQMDLFRRMNIHFIFQSEQKGTGHAARCAMESLWAKPILKAKQPVLVLPGDLPLVSNQLLNAMVSPFEKQEVLRLLTCELSDPTGYGRVVREGRNGTVSRIVEEKDADSQEKKIREVGASIYFFQSSFLNESLKKLSNQNAQGEYYLTDLIKFSVQDRHPVGVLPWKNPEDLRGVNDLWELAQAGKIMNERYLKNWAMKGVKFLDPGNTWVDATVELEEQVTIESGVILKGKTRIGKGTWIGPRVVLKDVEVGEGVQLKAGTIAEQSRIESGACVGPYAHLRPESWVGSRVKIGNFVELKKTKVGEDTSIAHLSYVGDAEVGRKVNIGCGFVTCNYDGRIIGGERKHRTVIEDEVFLGSDCQVVAPVKIGKGSYIASGSTITEDVESESLAIARARQINKPGYARKLKQAKEKDKPKGKVRPSSKRKE